MSRRRAKGWKDGRPKRIRVFEVEPCGRCGAMIGRRCVIRRTDLVKFRTCMVRIECRRCGAQEGHCRCPDPVTRPGELFPPGSSAWVSPATLAVAGATADDARRGVK